MKSFSSLSFLSLENVSLDFLDSLVSEKISYLKSVFICLTSKRNDNSVKSWHSAHVAFGNDSCLD